MKIPISIEKTILFVSKRSFYKNKDFDNIQNTSNSITPQWCKRKRQRELQNEVEHYCRNLQKCKGYESCNSLLNGRNHYANCVTARKNINNECFFGGDAGHQQAADSAYAGQQRCDDLYVKNRCGG